MKLAVHSWQPAAILSKERTGPRLALDRANRHTDAARAEGAMARPSEGWLTLIPAHMNICTSSQNQRIHSSIDFSKIVLLNF
jgi:hypothetical protein